MNNTNIFKNNLYNYSLSTINKYGNDIKQLQTEIAELPTNTNIENIQTEINNIELNITQLETEDLNLQNQVTTNTTSITNLETKKANITYVDQEINKILGGASGAYDTLLEIEQELTQNNGSVNTILTQLGTKASIEYVDNSINTLNTDLQSSASLLQNEINSSNSNILINTNQINNLIIAKADKLYVDSQDLILQNQITQNTTDISNFTNLSIGTVESGDVPSVTLINGQFNFVLKDGITPKLHINEIITGSPSNVSINQLLTTETDIYLDFVLEKGDKGDKGDRGQRGEGVSDDGDGNSLFSGLINGVNESVQYAAIAGAISGVVILQSQVAVIQTQILAIQTQLSILQLKTQNINSTLLETSFTGSIKSSLGDFSIDNGIQNIVDLTQTNNYFKNEMEIDGKLTVNNEIQCNKLETANIETSNISIDNNLNTSLKFGSHGDAHHQASISYTNQIGTSLDDYGELTLNGQKININALFGLFVSSLNSLTELKINAPIIEANCLSMTVNGLFIANNALYDQFGQDFFNQFDENFQNEFLNQFA